MRFFDPEFHEETPALSLDIVENFAAESAKYGDVRQSAAEVVIGFLENTGGLSPSEQAELLGMVLENQGSGASSPQRPSSTSGAQRSSSAGARPPSGATGAPRSPAARPQGAAAPGRRSDSGGVNFGQIVRGGQQALDVVTQGAQTIGALANLFRGGGAPQAPASGGAPAGPRGAAPPPGYDPATSSQLLAPFSGGIAQVQQQGFDQVATMLQALRQGQAPTLPGGSGSDASSAAPASGGAFDATALLRLILGNPQVNQALGTAAVLGPSAPREVVLPLPTLAASGGASAMPIPLGAVLNAIAALASRSMAELNSTTREDEPELPEYLVSESGDLLVDPADAEQSAALVIKYFRLAGEAERSGWFEDAPDEGLSEAELWEREAGLYERSLQ